MTKEELIQALERLNNSDPEYAKGSASSLLIKYIGDIEIQRAFNKLHRDFK